MARSTPIYDQAVGLLGELRVEVNEVSAKPETFADAAQLVAAEAIAYAVLAVAEALHGTIYCANAGAV